MNRVKEMLRSGETAIGATPFVEGEVQFLKNAGFDFLLFDIQHSPLEIKGLARPITSMRGCEAIPIIRVGDNRADEICYALDVGAKGIIVPMVNTADEAERMVASCKYPFDGIRSSTGARGDWGEFASYREYMDAVNEQLLIIPMIETAEAIRNLEGILKVQGIDVLLVGPSDLSINLDVPLDYLNPKYIDTLDIIAEKALAAGVVPGMFFVPPGIELNELTNKGYRFFTMPWNVWAREGIQAGLAGIR